MSWEDLIALVRSGPLTDEQKEVIVLGISRHRSSSDAFPVCIFRHRSSDAGALEKAIGGAQL
ncbi:hypothetical protein P7M03_16735 [Vibrio parahaemolyticus]|nr:hypothetical protein [Vibrio parahaemolyticus]